MSTANTQTGEQGAKRHATTAIEKQKQQLDRLLRDPAKPVFVPPPPKEKSVRAPREMMKNVQGSSAGAGSGEFHVYKANRRMEYERIKIMQDQAAKESVTNEFEARKRQREEEAEAKTAKNRAKRQKKKERMKGTGKHASGKKEGTDSDEEDDDGEGRGTDKPFKKRRIVAEVGQIDWEHDSGRPEISNSLSAISTVAAGPEAGVAPPDVGAALPVSVLSGATVVIHDED